MQTWTYNATLWWTPQFAGALHGELLSRLAHETTEFVYGISGGATCLALPCLAHVFFKHGE